MEQYLTTIILGSAAGIISRVFLTRLDYRQYPGYPHGLISHLSLGAIASALGAVAVPALLNKDFTAFTFLALAAQQFREIRNIERETLRNLEENRLEKRGNDYIEGIARTFEARNYLVMATAFITSAASLAGLWYAVATAIALLVINMKFMGGNSIGQICEVLPARLSFQGPVLFVNEISIMNIGLPASREKILNEGLGVVLKPHNNNARATLHDLGQRMAITYTAAVILGSKKDVDTPEFTPLARKNPDTGELAMFIIPTLKDMDALLAAVRRTPLLESASIKPLKAQAGSMAAR